MKLTAVFILFIVATMTYGQKQDKYWFFGTGTDGIYFNAQNVPVKLTNKYPGLGFEGNATATDPCTGRLLFYTDGINVIDSTHSLMSNGSGLLSNASGSQCVQICKIPGTCSKYYVISNSSWDNTPGSYYYSIVDFSTNPLGQVTVKNQLINAGNYHQAMRIIPKTNSNNLWLIGHIYNTATYHVYEITPAGFVGPVVYSFSNWGRSWTMEYNPPTHKLVNMGEDSIKVTVFDFDPTSGVLSNEQKIYNGPLIADVGNFSPDGSKLYAGLSTAVTLPGVLWQYDFSSGVWTNMNTCCWAHDVKTGPDGNTYFIHTYNSANPLATMTDANQTAIGNLCGYSTITNPGNFNGQVRRFPEFLQVPDPPVANLDTFSVSTGSSLIINPLANDSDPQGDTISLSAIITGPSYGTVSMNGNQIIYTANSGLCNGTDTIMYEILDNTCMCDTAFIIIHIDGVSPVATFTYTTTACTGTVDFTSTTANVNSFLWDFGDNSGLQNGNHLSHNYLQSGTYPVTLIVSGCGSDTVVDSVIVNVAPAPVAAFSNSTNTCSTTIHFTNQSNGATSYNWNFGDGISDTASNPSHTYLSGGAYTVQLIVSNACTADTLQRQIIVNSIVQPSASISQIQANCSLQIDFTSQITNTVSVLWLFGDGSTDTSQNVSHIYSSPGNYTVSLIIAGTCITDTVSKNINVKMVPLSVSAFGSTVKYCSYDVSFMNQSQNATSYYWDFGDTEFSTLVNPHHIYHDTGTYIVRLIAINQCGSDTNFQQVVDTFSKPEAAFTYNQPACASEIQFVDLSSVDGSTFWDFGDGITSKQPNPAHSYKEAGTFKVTLILNKGSQCTDTVAMAIQAEGPFEPQFYIPNCFTPNNDGLNDIFRIVSNDLCQGYTFYIFNRWGNLIFRSDDIYSGWDGKMNGDPVQEGVYCYIITGDGYQKTGSVAVIR